MHQCGVGVRARLQAGGYDRRCEARPLLQSGEVLASGRDHRFCCGGRRTWRESDSWCLLLFCFAVSYLRRCCLNIGPQATLVPGAGKDEAAIVSTLFRNSG